MQNFRAKNDRSKNGSNMKMLVKHLADFSDINIELFWPINSYWPELIRPITL